MFLHLGADTVIPLKKVVALLDYKDSSIKIHDNFIKNMREESRIFDISEGNPKSFIITDDMIYFSAISSLTLKKRAGMVFHDEDIAGEGE